MGVCVEGEEKAKMRERLIVPLNAFEQIPLYQSSSVISLYLDVLLLQQEERSRS
jgi:hypothetical protein